MDLCRLVQLLLPGLPVCWQVDIQCQGQLPCLLGQKFLNIFFPADSPGKQVLCPEVVADVWAPAEPKAALQTGKVLRLLRLKPKQAFSHSSLAPSLVQEKRVWSSGLLISLGTSPSETTYPAL